MDVGNIVNMECQYMLNTTKYKAVMVNRIFFYKKEIIIT